MTVNTKWLYMQYRGARLMERATGKALVLVTNLLVRYSRHLWYQRMAFHFARFFRTRCDRTDTLRHLWLIAMVEK
jgi:hypothetical protein